MKRQKEILHKLRELKGKYSNEGVEIVGVFGSYARGENDRYSDIDVAYRLDRFIFDSKYQGGFKKLLRLNDIKEEIEKSLKSRIDFVQFHSNKSSINREIERDIIYA